MAKSIPSAAPVAATAPSQTPRRSDQAAAAARAGFATLLVVFVSTRLLAIVLLRPGGYFGDWNDYNYFREMAALSSQGYYPYLHYWAEYPPVFPWLLVGAYKLSLLLPPWRHPLLWFQLPISLLLLAADVGNLWLVWRLGARIRGERGGLVSAWVYAGLFLPLYALSSWFDTLSVFWLLLGLELALQRRPLLAGLASGCGIAVKLFPVLALPVAARALRGFRAWAKLALGAALAPIAVFLPFYLASPTMTVASVRGILNRRSWETIWALLDGYYGTGGVAALADRLFYPESAAWQNPSRLPWTAITVVFAAVYLAVWWQAGLTRSREPSDAGEPPRGGPIANLLGRDGSDLDAPRVVALAGLTVALFLLYNKGFSQQFTLLLLPFVALLAPTARGALFAAAFMVDTTLVEGYVWINVFPDDRWLLRATVGVRTLLLALFAVEAASVLVPRLAGPWRRAKPALTGVLGFVAVALVVFGGYRLGAAYRDLALAGSPQAGAIRALQATPERAALLVTQESLYSALYPYTRPRPAYLVADAKLPDRVGAESLHARLSELTAGAPEVYLVLDAGQPGTPLIDATRRWLRTNYEPAEARTEAGVRLERFAARPAQARAEPAVFGGVIALDGVAAPTEVRPGQEMPIRLEWRAVAPAGRDYTAFVHLLNPEQKLVAQRDSPPLEGHYPTSLWRPGERVADEVIVAVPAGTAPGDYYLEIGVYYQPTMERLPARGGPASGDRALLGPYRVVGP